MILIRTAILGIVLSGICFTVGAAGDRVWQYPPDSDPEAVVTTYSMQSPRLFDRFGAVRSDDEKARLDNFAVELQQNPGTTGYIIVFYQRGKSPSQAKKRADNAKDYLILYRGLGENQVRSWDHCPRARVEYELWVVWNTDDFAKRYQKNCTLPAKRTVTR